MKKLTDLLFFVTTENSFYAYLITGDCTVIGNKCIRNHLQWICSSIQADIYEFRNGERNDEEHKYHPLTVSARILSYWYRTYCRFKCFTVSIINYEVCGNNPLQILLMYDVWCR